MRCSAPECRATGAGKIQHGASIVAVQDFTTEIPHREIVHAAGFRLRYVGGAAQMTGGDLG